MFVYCHHDNVKKDLRIAYTFYWSIYILCQKLKGDIKSLGRIQNTHIVECLCRFDSISQYMKIKHVSIFFLGGRGVGDV